MVVNIIPILACDPGGVWVVSKTEGTQQNKPRMAPALRNTFLLPERVSLWFIWLFFMLHSFLYCRNQGAIDQ